MRGAIPPLPLYVFMAWYLVKHRDIFTFYVKGINLELFNQNKYDVFKIEYFKSVTEILFRYTECVV
jgi:hypothetical protein